MGERASEGREAWASEAKPAGAEALGAGWPVGAPLGRSGLGPGGAVCVRVFFKPNTKVALNNSNE